VSENDDKTTLPLDSGQRAKASLEPQVTLVVYHREGVKVAPMAEDDPLIVGRVWPADVIVDDPALSRSHARFVWRGDAVEVEDLESTNGTRVGGAQLSEPARVPPGEAVDLGGVRVVVHVVGAEGQLQGIDGHERFVRAIGDEVLRSRTLGRHVSVVAIRQLEPDVGPERWVPRIRANMRPIDRMTVYDPRSVLLMIPETAMEDAARVARSLVQGHFPGEPSLVAGVAAYPHAASSHALIDWARQASRKATPSRPVSMAADSASRGDERDYSMVRRSEKMARLYELVTRVAASSVPVLIHGETGSGKEVVARSIHEQSPRASLAMRSVNCGAIPATLIESTLFGHEKGAFTGAEDAARGMFEQADGGTLFLDEIGELSAAAQAALLRVLDTKRLIRVGGRDEVEVDVRVIAATHRDLAKMVESGDFREDLLYRLNTVTLTVPALRERPEDIEPLARLFLEEASHQAARVIEGIDAAALDLLRRYHWQGNVRELRNEIERAVVLCRGAVVGPDDLSERVRSDGPSVTRAAPDTELPPPLADGSESFKDRVRHYETELILDALKRTGGNQTQAAKLLGMPLRTFVHKLKTYGIKKSYET
jgi:DNA-binding NtrC family response regulator